jgi:ABC-type proline/glycine betaine transport system ATPase subunit
METFLGTRASLVFPLDTTALTTTQLVDYRRKIVGNVFQTLNLIPTLTAVDTVNAKIVVDYLVKVNRELGKTIIMITHDPSVARAADRILRIEDGIIKMALTPSEVMAEEKAVSYIDQLRARIKEITVQLQQLDEDFKAGKVTGDKYVQKRQSLKQIMDSLKEEELHRMGVVT